MLLSSKQGREKVNQSELGILYIAQFCLKIGPLIGIDQELKNSIPVSCVIVHFNIKESSHQILLG
jgi:hypothetical protein